MSDFHRLTIAYDGGGYSGWQRQPNAMTVQERLEEALADLFGQRVVVVGAGRTDAGVHAEGQTAHLVPPRALPPKALVHATNHRLPQDIRVLAAHRMPDGFHAQRQALGKSYLYRLYRGRFVPPTAAPFHLVVPLELDVAAMRAALKTLPGRHDFTAFALAGGSHSHAVRRLFSATLDGSLDPAGGRALSLRFIGEGFLRGMVRSLVGTLIEIGRGDRPAEDIARLLEPGHGRCDAGFTADAHGLCLERVFYPPRWRSLDGYEG